MKPVIIAVAAAVFVAVRLGLRARRRGSGARPRAWWAGRLPELGGDTALVAAREVRERVRARAFRVVTALLLVAVGVAVVVPVLTRSKAGAEPVGVVGSLSAPQRAAVLGAARGVGAQVVLVAEADRAAAEAALRSGAIGLAVVDGRELLVDKAITAGDTSTSAHLAAAVAAELGLQQAFASAGLSPAQVQGITGAKPLPVASLQPAASSSTRTRGTSLFGIIIVFIMLSQYETWTLIGVMEEKSSRVVEVLLATVRPIELLGGKVLGIGLVAMGQAAAVLAFGLGLGAAVGSDILHGTAPLMLAAALLWLVVGYAFYCWVYAAAGSMAERQDQIQTLALPLSLPMVLGYVTALTAAASGHASVFVQVLAYLPPTAPFAMPVMVGLGAVSWWGFVASVVISLVCTAGVARLAAGVYRRAVLRTGRRVRLREVLATSAAR